MRYEIDSANAVRIWQEHDELPFIYQPFYPSGTSFESRDAAEKWAIAKIAEHEDIDAPEAQNFPNEEPKVQWRKIHLQREALKASAKAKLIAGQPLTAEEADTLVL